MDRDYDDLKNENLAVYNFRGYTIVRLDKKRKFVELGRDAQMCALIPEDLKLLSIFFDDCYKFVKDEIDDVESIRVS